MVVALLLPKIIDNLVFISTIQFIGLIKNLPIVSGITVYYCITLNYYIAVYKRVGVSFSSYNLIYFELFSFSNL